jgi:DNA-directed RNA polymerase alpha subunit
METVGQLSQYSQNEIRKFRGVGECIVAEITEYMATIGFPLQIQK